MLHIPNVVGKLDSEAYIIIGLASNPLLASILASTEARTLPVTREELVHGPRQDILVVSERSAAPARPVSLIL